MNFRSLEFIGLGRVVLNILCMFLLMVSANVHGQVIATVATPGNRVSQLGLIAGNGADTYLVWEEQRSGLLHILRSDDGGQTWSPYAQLSAPGTDFVSGTIPTNMSPGGLWVFTTPPRPGGGSAVEASLFQGSGGGGATLVTQQAIGLDPASEVFPGALGDAPFTLLAYGFSDGGQSGIRVHRTTSDFSAPSFVSRSLSGQVVAEPQIAFINDPWGERRGYILAPVEQPSGDVTTVLLEGRNHGVIDLTNWRTVSIDGTPFLATMTALALVEDDSSPGAGPVAIVSGVEGTGSSVTFTGDINITATGTRLHLQPWHGGPVLRAINGTWEDLSTVHRVDGNLVLTRFRSGVWRDAMLLPGGAAPASPFDLVRVGDVDLVVRTAIDTNGTPPREEIRLVRVPVNATPTPTGTPTMTPSPSPSPTLTPTPTWTSTPVPTPTRTPTRPPTQTATPTPSACCFAVSMAAGTALQTELDTKDCVVPGVPRHFLSLASERTATVGAGDLGICVEPLSGLGAHPALTAVQPAGTGRFAWTLEPQAGLIQTQVGVVPSQIGTSMLAAGLAPTEVDTLGVWSALSGWRLIPMTAASTSQGWQYTPHQAVDVLSGETLLLIGNRCLGFGDCPTATPAPTETSTVTPTLVPSGTPTTTTTPSPTPTAVPTASATPTLSPTTPPTQTPTSPPPPPDGVYLAGFGVTRLTSRQPVERLELYALAHGGADVVDVAWGGIKTGIRLADDGILDDGVSGNGLYGFQADLDLSSVSPAVLLLHLEIEGRHQWPELRVLP